MVAYLWSQLSLKQQEIAMTSAMAAELMSSRVAAHNVQLATSEAEEDRAAIWLDLGGGKWEARAALWPRDLAAGVKVAP